MELQKHFSTCLLGRALVAICKAGETDARADEATAGGLLQCYSEQI